MYHILHESQEKPKPSRQHGTHKKRQDETNDAQIEIESGRKRRSGRLDVCKSGVCGAGLNRNME